MDKGGWGKSVGEGRAFIGPAQGECGHRHHQPGQTENVDNELGHIDRGAQKTVTQPFFLGQMTETLGEEQRISGSIDEREKIVVTGGGLAGLAPVGGAAEVGADGQHHRGLLYHRLVEVGGGQLVLHPGIAGHYYAVKLEVAHGLGARGGGK